MWVPLVSHAISSKIGDKSLNSSKLSINTFGGKNDEPKMTKEEYQKFAQEAKRSVFAMNNVVNATDKILNWAYNAGSAPGNPQLLPPK